MRLTSFNCFDKRSTSALKLPLLEAYMKFQAAAVARLQNSKQCSAILYLVVFAITFCSAKSKLKSILWLRLKPGSHIPLGREQSASGLTISLELFPFSETFESPTTRLNFLLLDKVYSGEGGRSSTITISVMTVVGMGTTAPLDEPSCCFLALATLNQSRVGLLPIISAHHKHGTSQEQHDKSRRNQ